MTAHLVAVPSEPDSDAEVIQWVDELTAAINAVLEGDQSAPALLRVRAAIREGMALEEAGTIRASRAQATLRAAAGLLGDIEAALIRISRQPQLRLVT
jgi:hypothetical protein